MTEQHPANKKGNCGRCISFLLPECKENVRKRRQIHQLDGSLDMGAHETG
jgi:hypothetical protein